jgi:outer membrane cobalamin receptor
MENKIDIFKPLSLNLSVRVDDYSNFGTEVNPGLNILYEVNNNTDLYFFIARSFRSPTFNDLYWPSDGFFAGNPNLNPETGISGELGFNTVLADTLDLSLVIFRNDVDDLISWAEGADGVWRPSNVDSAIINGAEVRAGFNIGKNLSVDIFYAYLEARDDKTKKFIPYQPEYKAGLNLVYHLPYDFIVELGARFVNRAYSNRSNTQFVKRYSLLDLNINKKINEVLSIFINFDNLTNRKYQKVRNYPMPGFRVDSGVRFKF